MAKAKKCPYCGSSNISKTIAGWAEEGTGLLVGAGVGMLIKSATGWNHLHFKTKVFADITPTQFKCKQCSKTFHVTSDGDKVSVLNSDIPNKERT